jgi:hypothetical protein
MSKLILQVCTAALALIPIVTGIISLGAPAFICWQARVAEAFGP